MMEVSKEQIRRFRLNSHHLDRRYSGGGLSKLAGAAGFQNSPPGAWEAALWNRTGDYSRDEMTDLLERDKVLIQAWSLRGAPIVFPVEESEVFLAALKSEPGESWIYTDGIGPALDHLEMELEELLKLLIEVLPELDHVAVKSKNTLDEFLADRILPLLPEEKKPLWQSHSMYGDPNRQTAGGAAVSFLLRPCSFMGFVVFAGREGRTPVFTSYKNWTGKELTAGFHMTEMTDGTVFLESESPVKRLTWKFLHAYGPALEKDLARWLGSSLRQSARFWQTVTDEIVPVSVNGTERWALASDLEALLDPPAPERKYHLLGAHDPYLGLYDRDLIVETKARQQLIWQKVANPGVILKDGAVMGLWRTQKKGQKLTVRAELWNGDKKVPPLIQRELAVWAAFNDLKLDTVLVR